MCRNPGILAAVASIVLLTSSCAKEGPTGPIGPSGPAYIGYISGHVSLYDQYGNKVLNNLDSVAIALGSNSVTGIDDTVSRPNSSGYYIYSNLYTGQYYITAADTGYGATNTDNFEFVSGNLNKDIKLSAIPTFSLSFGSYYTSGSPNDSLVINCTPDEQIRSCVIFLNHAPSLVAGESYVLSYAKNIPANSAQITAIIDSQELHAAGFASGSMIYYTVFSHALNDQSSYEDLTTGNTVYTAVSYPTIDSALAP